MVEGYQPARGQVTGRTSQNKTLNFTVPDGVAPPAVGAYVPVRVVRAHPNSLVGELVESIHTQDAMPAYSDPAPAAGAASFAAYPSRPTS